MGPLQGLRIIELSGIGPAPFAGMMLADMGADVIRVERLSGGYFGLMTDLDFNNRGKRCIAVDLKKPQGVEIVKALISDADGFIEGYRPGVAERLGLGPDELLALNPRLVYGRMTGWGQDGPLAETAGHDINYIALSGALHAMGEKDSKPMIPLNLVGDFGGGGMMFAFGMVCAMLEAQKSGRGQVVDAAMIDGVASLMATMYSSQQTDFWNPERGTNVLDSGAPFYNVYECADGEYFSVGAVEPQFYQSLLDGLGLDPAALPDQMDRSQWPAMKRTFANVFKTRSRDEWEQVFATRNACTAPVLRMNEVPRHAHIQARNTIVDVDGRWQPAPAPRLSRTPGEIRGKAAATGEQTDKILEELGMDSEKLRMQGIVV